MNNTILYEISVFVSLGISLLLQTFALVAPGWVIDAHGEDSLQFGIFYHISCKGGVCETFNSMKTSFDYIKEASSTTEELIREKDLLLGYIRTVVGVVLSWMFTLISVLVVGCCLRKGKTLTYVWFLVATVTSVSGIIMGELTYVYLVDIDIRLRLYSSSDSLYNNNRVLFPYCLFAFAIACLLEFEAAVIMFKCHYHEVTRLRKIDANHSEV